MIKHKLLTIALSILCAILLLTLPIGAANYTMTVQYALNSSALNYFKACLGNAGFFDKYIIFQQSQYMSYCFIGKMSVSGNVVSIKSGQLITYNSNASTSDRRYIAVSDGAGHTVTITSGVIYYTNLNGILSNPIPASVQENKDMIADKNAMNILYTVVMVMFVYIGFQFVKKRWINVW